MVRGPLYKLVVQGTLSEGYNLFCARLSGQYNILSNLAFASRSAFLSYEDIIQFSAETHQELRSLLCFIYYWLTCMDSRKQM